MLACVGGSNRVKNACPGGNNMGHMSVRTRKILCLIILAIMLVISRATIIQWRKPGTILCYNVSIVS